MKTKITTILFIILSLAITFFLSGCFHIPDKDWKGPRINNNSIRFQNNRNDFYQSINIVKQGIKTSPSEKE